MTPGSWESTPKTLPPFMFSPRRLLTRTGAPISPSAKRCGRILWAWSPRTRFPATSGTAATTPSPTFGSGRKPPPTGRRSEPGRDTDGTGNYVFNVGNGTWTVGVSCGAGEHSLNSSYLCPPFQSVIIDQQQWHGQFHRAAPHVPNQRLRQGRQRQSDPQCGGVRLSGPQPGQQPLGHDRQQRLLFVQRGQRELDRRRLLLRKQRPEPARLPVRRPTDHQRFQQHQRGQLHRLARAVPDHRPPPRRQQQSHRQCGCERRHDDFTMPARPPPATALTRSTLPTAPGTFTPTAMP